ncbi:MAG: Trm112 family protein [Hyphomicrobiaceae bacterium]
MGDENSDSTSEPAHGGQEATEAAEERVDRRLLELLVCPVTKTSLDYDEARQELISRKARLAYPIRRGVPHMLPSEARHLDD